PGVVAATAIERDGESDPGSRSEIDALTDAQIDDLASLGRVWGFLRYHHPRIATGELHWDYELFRVLPAVLAAGDAEARNRVLSAWVDSLGVPAACDGCAEQIGRAHV